MDFFFETHRHIGHIERDNLFKNHASSKKKHLFLCVLCASYVSKKMTYLLFTRYLGAML
jgi:hypothetical protein